MIYNPYKGWIKTIEEQGGPYSGTNPKYDDYKNSAETADAKENAMQNLDAFGAERATLTVTKGELSMILFALLCAANNPRVVHKQKYTALQKRLQHAE